VRVFGAWQRSMNAPMKPPAHSGAADIGDDAELPPLNAFDRTMRDDRREARSLYWRGWTIQQIADDLMIKRPTVASWKKRDRWDHASPVQIIEDRIEVRVAAYADKADITEGEMKRVDFWMRQMERSARIRKYNESGKEADLNPKIKARNDEKAVAKRATKKNQLTFEQIEQCRSLFHEQNYPHQQKWWESSQETIRFILKSRQIGATWYMAREAFIRAMDTGNDQIFLSASQNQSLIFREYIIDFVREATGVELTGSKPLSINRLDEDGEPMPPVNFRFLATNFRTAQGYNGDVYLDECFWVGGFADFDDAATGMASQKRYRITYFSKPSTINHPAHKKWNGDDYNRDRTKKDQVRFDISHKALKEGVRGADGIWRQIVTLDDAIAQGFDLIDRASVERRYSVEKFRNQYLCQFLDDSQSSFPFAMLSPCQVDSFYKWRDFKPALTKIPGARPYGDKSVWIGVDPNNQGRDDAAISVLAAPEKAGGKIRLLEKIRFTGEDFAGQSARVKEVAARYNVTDISVDTTGGMGKAVWELIKIWFPSVRRIDYSVATKSALVLKMQNVIRNGRFEFDRADTDVLEAFMAIKPSITPSGKQVTYITQRSEGVGHGDIAWAIMHAVSNEPMNADLAGAHGGTIMFLDDHD